MTTLISNHVEKKPGVCGGKACIAGTRVRVQDVYIWHKLQGRSVDEIVAGFPQLKPADIHAALTYYWDHRIEIHAEMKAADELVTALKATIPSPMRQKLSGQSADGDPVSS